METQNNLDKRSFLEKKKNRKKRKKEKTEQWEIRTNDRNVRKCMV
jgi:hypothetical protein